MSWITVLHTIPAENWLKLVEYCKAAEKRDNSFRFNLKPDSIVVYSPTRNKAYRRGVRIHVLFNCFFEVIKTEEVYS